MRTIKYFIVCVIATIASLCVTSCSKEYSSPLKGQVVKDLTFESSQSSNTVTIADADHVVVLKDGVTAEEGSPAELIRKNGIFKHMTEQQLISQNWKM